MGEEEPREERKLKRDRCPHAWHWNERKRKCRPDIVHLSPGQQCAWDYVDKLINKEYEK